MALLIKTIIALFTGGLAGTKGPNWVLLWVVSVFDVGSLVPAVTKLSPQWAASAYGFSGLIWHFGAERDLLNL